MGYNTKADIRLALGKHIMRMRNDVSLPLSAAAVSIHRRLTTQLYIDDKVTRQVI